MSILINYLLKKLVIKIKTVAPYNHQSLQAEHGIKSVATIIMKHLTGLGHNWIKHQQFAMYNYNTFCSPNLNGFSPYELGFGKKS